MFPYFSKVGHICRKEQGLLSCISHIASRSTLEIFDRGTSWQKGPIQYHGRGLGKDCHRGLASLICLGLSHPRLFGSFGVHSLLSLWALPPFHYFLPPLVPFSFMVNKLNWGRGRKFGLGGLLWCFAPSRGLHHLQQAGHLFSLHPYVCWDGSLFLSVICLYREKIVEVTNKSFWRQKLIEDVKVVLRIRHFDYSFLFFLFFFFFFLDDWTGRCGSYFWYAFKYGSCNVDALWDGTSGEKAWSYYTDPMQIGSFALMTHLGAWKALEIGSQLRIRCAARSWPSLWTNTSAFKIWSKLD